MLWPPPRTAISSSLSRPNRIAAATSSALVGRTTIAGRRSIIPFQTRRASSYPASRGRTTSPPYPREKFARLVIVRTLTGLVLPLRPKVTGKRADVGHRTEVAQLVGVDHAADLLDPALRNLEHEHVHELARGRSHDDARLT